ncbi:MAG: ribbon-helix-helix domain-containing protein [Hyphomicrobiales bacterium]
MRLLSWRRHRRRANSLEDAFWNDLKQIAYAQRVVLSELVAKIDGTRAQSNLSSAIRQFVLQHFRDQSKRKEVVEAHRSSRTVGDERFRGQSGHGACTANQTTSASIITLLLILSAPAR